MDARKESYFDKEDFYKNEMEPHIRELLKIASRNNVPFFITTAVSNNERTTKYKNTGFLPGSNDIELTDNFFRKILLVCAGVELVNPGAVKEDEKFLDYIFEGENIDEDGEPIKESKKSATPIKKKVEKNIMNEQGILNIDIIGDL